MGFARKIAALVHSQGEKTPVRIVFTPLDTDRKGTLAILKIGVVGHDVRVAILPFSQQIGTPKACVKHNWVGQCISTIQPLDQIQMPNHLVDGQFVNTNHHILSWEFLVFDTTERRTSVLDLVGTSIPVQQIHRTRADDGLELKTLDGHKTKRV